MVILSCFSKLQSEYVTNKSDKGPFDGGVWDELEVLCIHKKNLHNQKKGFDEMQERFKKLIKIMRVRSRGICSDWKSTDYEISDENFLQAKKISIFNSSLIYRFFLYTQRCEQNRVIFSAFHIFISWILVYFELSENWFYNQLT